MSILDNSSGTKNRKEWWAPIWKGLVMDQGAHHYKVMGSALWLFLYLVLNANRGTGVLQRKLKTIASDTGIKERTIRSWLKVLKEDGYIKAQATGHSLRIQVQKWKVGSLRQNIARQTGRVLSSRLAEVCRSNESISGQNSPCSSHKPTSGHSPNDITIKRDLLKSDIERKKSWKSVSDAFKGKDGRTREEFLAFEIAKALDDLKGLPLYISYARQYPEFLLRRVLGEVKEIPSGKIKKSRGALFNYLIQKYGKQRAKDSGH